MRGRLLLLGLVGVVVIVACVAYGHQQFAAARARAGRAPSVPVASAPMSPGAGSTQPFDTARTIVFRHTGLDSEYGVVATVPLEDPSGARTFGDVSCDRVDATRDGALSCLSTERGVVTRFEAHDLDASGRVLDSVALPGVPSRTRFSPDGSLVATTSFVTGHSYLSAGFSTATVVRHPDGTSFGNLERFALIIDGRRVRPTDRNVWGVTFADDDRTFYATVGTGGKTYLVKDDLEDRTLTSVASGVECPSLSPDGTRIAFKQVTGTAGGTTWTPAVLDLATGERTVLDGETGSVDDQIEWLDDDILLYGMPRADEAGVTDVWSLSTDPGAKPQLLIEQAWSPSVVR